MNELHRGCAENVSILDPHLGIMACLGLADLLVTDESSVMVEALLLGIPVVAVTDWLIPDCNPPRPAMIPFDFPVRTTRAELHRTVADVLANLDCARIDTARLRDQQFACLGESAPRIMDVIEAGWEGRVPTIVPVAEEVSPPPDCRITVSIPRSASGAETTTAASPIPMGRIRRNVSWPSSETPAT